MGAYISCYSKQLTFIHNTQRRRREEGREGRERERERGREGGKEGERERGWREKPALEFHQQ